MDIVVPNGDEPYPILIYIHGGGWLSGNKKNYRRICRAFAAAGYLVFNLNYRLAPKHPFPTPLKDIITAAQWIQEHAEEYGGDTSRIFLSGDSAGAHLTTLLAASSINTDLFAADGISSAIPLINLKGLMLFYGAYDLQAGKSSFPFAATMSKSLLGPDSDQRPGLAGLVSPINHLGPQFPPVFLCSGEMDPLHPQTVSFATACELLGVPLEKLIFSKNEHPEAVHSFLNYYFLKCSKIALQRTLTFMAIHSVQNNEDEASAG